MIDMTRIRRIETLNRIFFVTFNLDRSAKPLQPTERTILLSILHRLRAPNDFALYGYVVMPDHVHLLLHAKSVPLPTIMRLLKAETSAALGQSRPFIRPLWHRSYHDFICRRARDFANKLEYTHENPRAASLVKHPAHWPWSSYLYYEKEANLPVLPDKIDFSGDPNEFLWPAPWRRL